MKPFFIFDFFQNAGKKMALGIGSLMLILGLLILFFPELLRAMIGFGLVFGALPLVIYGIKDDFGNRNPPGTSSGEDVRIIYPD